jgi:hypothetical protein
MQCPHYIWGEGNAILTRQFKYAHISGGKMQCPHYDPNPHYLWEREMQYLHDILNMHIIHGGKM